MRNGHKSPRKITLTLLLAAAVLSGCGGKGDPDARRRGAAPPQAVLDAGYRALESQKYNDAISKADEFLSDTPHGPGSAEALYLKGRAFEGKNLAGVADTSEAAANLQAARTAYLQALGMNPPQPLAAYLRTSLGNVAYFQDDYGAAIGQLSAAYEQLDLEDIKAWALYRIGLCHQRLGQFEQADQVFANVVRDHPNTIPAQRAREHQGARAFYVQLATFAQAPAADKVIAELKREGAAATRVAGPNGLWYLRAGPIGSYSQAQYTRNRFAHKFPDAVIMP